MPTITKTGAGVGSNGNRIDAKLEISYSKKSNTSYTVSTALYTRVGDGYTSSSSSNNNCTSWVNINGAAARRHNFTINYADIGHNWELLGTNTTEVNTNGQAKSIDIIGQWEMPSSNWVTGGYISGSVTLPALTSACTAPTTITIKKTIQKPSGKVKISWSGATSGTNNKINAYNVYWRVDKAPTTTTYTGVKKVTTDSYEFTIPSNATRGSKYYFKIVTRGEAGSEYFSSISSKSVNVKVNQLPSAPVVNLDKEEVNYDNDKITIKSISSTDADNQSLTYQYAIDNNDKINCVNGDTFNNARGKKVYFYDKDALGEYSPATIKEIKNKLPVLKFSNNFTATSLYSSSLLNPESGSYNINNKYAKTIGANIEVTKSGDNCTFSFYKITQKYTNPYAEPTNQWSKKQYIGKKINYTGSSYTFSYDTNSDFTQNDVSTFYKIGVEFSDGIDTIDQLSSDYFIVAPPPQILEVWNDYSKDSNIEHSIPYTFYNSGRLKLSSDTAYENNITYLTKNDLAISFKNLEENNTETGIQWKVPNNDLSLITPNTLYKINRTFYRNGIPFTSSFNITSCGLPRLLDNTEIKESNISSIKNLLNNTIKPYSMKDSNINSLISITPYLENYNYLTPLIESDVYNGIINFVLEYNGKRTQPLIISGLEKTDSSYDFNILYKNFYDPTTNSLNLNLNDRNTVNLIVQFKDVFNHIHEIKKENYLILDFREPLTGTLNMSRVSDDYETNLAENILYEKSKIRYSFSYSSPYHNGEAIIKTYISRTNEKIDSFNNLTWEPYPILNSKSWKVYKDTPLTVNIDREVSEINTSKYLYFKIETILNDQTQTIYYDENDNNDPTKKKPFISQKFISPPVDKFIGSFSYDSSNKNLTYSGTISDAGAGRINATKTYVGLYGFDIGIQYYEAGKENEALYIGNNYVETIDTVFNSEKTYYELIYQKTNDTEFKQNKKYYELVNSQYVETIDTVFNSEKTYYEQTYQKTNDTEFIQDKIYYESDGFHSLYFYPINDTTTIPIKIEQFTPFNFNGKTYYNFRLVIRTYLNNNKNFYKETIGNSSSIYDILPTVSYRKNQIGINIKPESVNRSDELTTSENIKDTGALIIQTTSDKKNIYIISADNVLKIKMTDGSIDGVIIDCGTW